MLATRLAIRSTRRIASSTPTVTPQFGRRLASTSASNPTKRSSWKGLFARWGVAGGALYLYSTSGNFREQANAGLVPPQAFQVPTKPQIDPSESFPSALDIAEVRQRKATEATVAAAAKAQAEADSKDTEAKDGRSSSETVSSERSSTFDAGLEQEASQQGAYNEETGEINWDCPCLGGMASGPCGEDFKEAFSCFIFSTEEQKGIDCVDKFKAMQTCFRKYPDVYGDEIEPEDGDEENGPSQGRDDEAVTVESEDKIRVEAQAPEKNEGETSS